MAAADGEENDLAQLIQAAIRDAVYPLQQQMIKSQEQMIKSQEQMRRSQQEINQLKAQQQLQNAEQILEIDIDNPEDTSGEDFHGFDNQDHGSDHGDDQRANQHGRQGRHRAQCYKTFFPCKYRSFPVFTGKKYRLQCYKLILPVFTGRIYRENLQENFSCIYRDFPVK